MAVGRRGSAVVVALPVAIALLAQVHRHFSERIARTKSPENRKNGSKPVICWGIDVLRGKAKEYRSTLSDDRRCGYQWQRRPRRGKRVRMRHYYIASEVSAGSRKTLSDVVGRPSLWMTGQITDQALGSGYHGSAHAPQVLRAGTVHVCGWIVMAGAPFPSSTTGPSPAGASLVVPLCSPHAWKSQIDSRPVASLCSIGLVCPTTGDCLQCPLPPRPVLVRDCMELLVRSAMAHAKTTAARRMHS